MNQTLTELQIFAKLDTFIKKYRWKWRYSPSDWQELVEIRDNLQYKLNLQK